MFLALDEISVIQLDHTSRCNLRCPQCARTSKDGGVNPNFPAGADLTVENYRAILEPFRHREIKIFHCGNYGDAAASPTFLETLDFCLTYAPKAYFTLITNGSLHTPAWWAELGQKFSRSPKNKVCFSIDGLEDTNPIYRVGSSFTKIIANVKAFTEAGGAARWDYLVFEHNRHQVGQARALAEKLGVRQFNLKNTSRFVVTDTDSYSNEVQNKKTKIHDVAENPNVRDFQEIKKNYKSFDEYAAQCSISCKYQKDKTIYIDFETRVWPCCWMGQPLFAEDQEIAQARHISKLMKKYGRDFNRLDLHGWDVLRHDYFSRYLERSWRTDFSDPDTPRLFTCGRTCGEKFEFSSGYGQNRQVERIV